MQKNTRLFYFLLVLFLSGCSTEIFTKGMTGEFFPPYDQNISPDIKSLHKELFIVDMHTDSLLWNRDLTQKSNKGHVDIPRLIEGNVAIQIFAVPTEFRVRGFNLMPLKSMVEGESFCNWFSLTHFALYRAQKLHNFAKNAPDVFRVIESKQDLLKYQQDRKKKNDMTAGILAIEGAHALEENIKNVKLFAQRGYRFMSLSHLSDNLLGGSTYGDNQSGITLLGKKYLIEMEKNNIIIDLAHSSSQALDEIFALHQRKILKKPVIVSHTGVIGVHPHIRNLSDRHIIEIAKTGGIICIGFFNPALPYAHPQLVADSIYYVVDLLNTAGFDGINHIGLGSDFDGGVTVPFDTTGNILITQALLSPKYNFSKEDIHKIMGGNLLRFLLQVLPEK